MSRKRCSHIIDVDATVNGEPHQTIYCATIVGAGEKYCQEHAPLHQDEG